jgi:hypothetical protein
MLSKMVTDRLKDAGLVLSALGTLGPKLGPRAKELFAPYLQAGEVMPNFELIAKLIHRLIEDRAKKMETADSKHNDELADDAAPREARDMAQRELYAALVDVKQGVATVFGESWHAQLRIPKEIPQDPSQLWRLAGEIGQALRSAKLPKPRLKGVKTFDSEPWIEQISEPAERLGKAIDDVSREVREAQATLVDKSRAVAAYDEGFSTGTALVMDLLRMFGESEHADRLRPSARRPGTLEVSEPSEASEPKPPPA